VEDLNQIGNWSYGRQLKLSSEISRFFSSTYRSLSARLRSEERQTIDQYDLDILGRKLMALFSRKRHKLRLTPFLTGHRLILGRCVVQYEKSRSWRKRWDLYDATLYPLERGTRRWKIFSAESIVKALAWLVNNGLYDFQTTAVEMPPNPSGVRLTDLVDLLKHIQSFFLPAYYHLTEGTRLEDEAALDRIMVVIDMEEISKLKKPTTLDMVYRNSWGEMFAETYPYAEGINLLKGYLKGIENKENGDHELGARFKVHIPQSAEDGDAAGNLSAQMTKELGLDDIQGAGVFRSFYGLEDQTGFYPILAKGL
jgi:adenylate cyclase